MTIPLCGFINIDKPAGMTSHDVVYRLRQWLKIKHIGHAGTLDPDATGVLPIAIGPANRLTNYLPDDKVYLAQIQLGITTTTDDLSGAIISEVMAPDLIDEKIKILLDQFTGNILQKPPIYSAIQKNGQRFYNTARKKLETEQKILDPKSLKNIVDNMLEEIEFRSIQIKQIELIAISHPILTVRIHCSSGTYIRSIARDLGNVIGCGGCLKSLRREKSGIFKIDSALRLETIKNHIDEAKLDNIMLFPQQIFRTSTFTVNTEQALQLSHGQSILLSDTDINIAKLNEQNNELIIIVSKMSSECAPVALCSITSDQKIKVKINLSSPASWQDQIENK